MATEKRYDPNEKTVVLTFRVTPRMAHLAKELDVPHSVVCRDALALVCHYSFLKEKKRLPLWLSDMVEAMKEDKKCVLRTR